MLSAPLPSFRLLGHGLGQAKNAKMLRHCLKTQTEKVPDFVRNQELFGGDCWTRTSDLLRVKNCVMTGAGGHSRRVPHRHRSFVPPQGLKLYIATAVYSLKSPTHSIIQYLVNLTNTAQGRSRDLSMLYICKVEHFCCRTKCTDSFPGKH